jgi:hypothetical protein
MDHLRPKYQGTKSNRTLKVEVKNVCIHVYEYMYMVRMCTYEHIYVYTLSMFDYKYE